MTIQHQSAGKLYFRSVFTGILLNILLLTLVVIILRFEYKSAVCLYLWGIIGYTLKSFLFFSPYLLFKNPANLDNIPVRIIIVWSPLLLYFSWFLLVIVLQIEIFYVDISFGYIQRFPHFVLQLLAAMITGMITTIKMRRMSKNV